MDPLLAFDAVTVNGPSLPRLDAVTCTIPSGGVTAITGPPGAGKTTLLRCANALVVPDSGTVAYRGRDLRTVDPETHRREVGMVFGRPVPFSGTVLQNLRIADPKIDPAAAGALLRRVALSSELLPWEATRLSAGDALRMGLARTLAAAGPDGLRLLLVDAPDASLDGDAIRELERLLRRFASEGVDVLFVGRDPDQVERLADRTVRLEAGRVVRGG